jgi:hypothetical protein
MVTADEIPNPENLKLALRINGQDRAGVQHQAPDLQDPRHHQLLLDDLRPDAGRCARDRHAGWRGLEPKTAAVP